MSAMESSSASRPATSEPVRTATAETKPYGDRHHKSVIVKGIFKGPILPEWLRKLFRRKDTPAR